jgi:hypothetical protein
MGDRRFLGQWIRATWAGWVIGLPLIAVLALIGEAAGIGGVQVLVGAGMGTGVGLLQGGAIRSLLHGFAPWFWSCVVGLSSPFLAADFAKVAGWNFTYSLHLCVAVGGLIVGAWQAFLLRSRVRLAGWWTVSSVAAWTLAAGTAALADSLRHAPSFRGLWAAVAYLAIVASGGLILGLVTGLTLVWLRRQTPAA